MQVRYLFSDGQEMLLEPHGKPRAVLYKKVEQGHYFVNMALNNRSVGVQMRLTIQLPVD